MMNFRKFLEQGEPRDPDATGVWNGTVPAEADPNTFVSTFPDFETYKQQKIAQDQSKSTWNDMQWRIQYLFDKHHADAVQQYRLQRRAAPQVRQSTVQTHTPTPQPKKGWLSSLSGIFRNNGS